LVAYEQACTAQRPDLTLVVGDVNSTLACAIVAKKLHIPVAHVEAGLRSGDRRMPEEINRLVTDSISDLYFVTEPAGLANLRHEGQPDSAIHHVGHVMVDNLLYQAERLSHADPSGFDTAAFKRKHPRYGVVTLHRPSNVDHPATLAALAGALRNIARELPLAFPVHPRTRQVLQVHGIDLGPNIELLPPQPYMAFLYLWKDAALVLTDSGGLQEETTALGVPCITLRDNTERPITVEQGTNVLGGTDPARIEELAGQVLRTGGKKGQRPALWDGKAAQRIVAVLAGSTTA
jgi:UDP-N-acetylglucosamine 2-epimerase (non-hydrolysing)